MLGAALARRENCAFKEKLPRRSPWTTEITYWSLRVFKRDKSFADFFQTCFREKKKNESDYLIFFFNRSFTMPVFIAELVAWLIPQCGKPFSHSFPKRRVHPFFFRVCPTRLLGRKEPSAATRGWFQLSTLTPPRHPFFLSLPNRCVADACIQRAERSLLAATSGAKILPRLFCPVMGTQDAASGNEMMKCDTTENIGDVTLDQETLIYD